MVEISILWSLTSINFFYYLTKYWSISYQKREFQPNYHITKSGQKFPTHASLTIYAVPIKVFTILICIYLALSPNWAKGSMREEIITSNYI